MSQGGGWDRNEETAKIRRPKQAAPSRPPPPRNPGAFVPPGQPSFLQPISSTGANRVFITVVIGAIIAVVVMGYWYYRTQGMSKRDLQISAPNL